MVGKYKVITLCGSTKFKEEFMKVQKELTLKGNIVISVGLFGHSGDQEVWENMDEGTLTKTKEMLDDMHKRKIDKKSNFRKLWIARINAGARMNGTTYSKLIAGMKKANIVVNRKMLAELAVNDPKAFAQIVETAKNA